MDQQEQGRRLFPHIAAAEALSKDDSGILDDLKVLVVGNLPRPEIAARLRLGEDVVTTWELLFYDVRSTLTSYDWLLKAVIRPEEIAGNGSLAAKLKFATAGPVMARAVLDAESRVALQRGVSLFDQKICLMIRFQQALQLPFDSERAKLFFIKRHADLLYRERRLGLAERRVVAQSEQALRKEKIAQARQEIAARHEQERAAKKVERMQRKERQETAQQERQARKQGALIALLRSRKAAEERASNSPLAALRWEYAKSATVGSRTAGESECTTWGEEIHRSTAFQDENRRQAVWVCGT